MMKFNSTLAAVAWFLAGTFSPQARGLEVSVRTGPDAPELEIFAATEMKRILESLYDANISETSKNLILVGSLSTNPEIKEIAGDAWPNDLSQQGHLLKSFAHDGRTVLVVGGGSPVAVLWAVYELGHHFGMRYTLHDDFLPIELPEFSLSGIDRIFEPDIRIRAWRTLDPGLAGQESWGLADHQDLLRQLAKLKFNLVTLVAHPEFPPSEGIPVSGNTAGRSVFAGSKFFGNPDFADLKTDEDRTKAGKKLIDGIKKTATALGMGIVEVPPNSQVPGVETLSLAQPKGGVLPQFFTGRLPGTLASIRKMEQDGFEVQCWIPGNLNPDVYYLSRASFDAGVTPRQALGDLVTPICGEGVAERLATGFAAIEEISALIEKEDSDFAVPDPQMFMEHFESTEEVPEWWAKATELYGTAVNEMYRGNTRARGGARPFILYHAKYFTFALHYMTAVKAARDASRAQDADDTLAYVEHLETSVEAMHNALQIYADVARDNSDRGVIAVLNEYAYRPLLKALDEAPLP